jgi:ketosteroid isomerase-like protein
MTKDIVKLTARYHDALNKFDFETIEKMFTEDAEYYSAGVGSVFGRDAIIHAMRVYFNEFSDQVSVDESLEQVDEQSVRSHWRLSATTKSSGREVKRQGIETVYFNAKGLIEVVEVQDVSVVKP